MRAAHRPLVAVAVAGLLASITLVGGASAAASGADWPQARGGAAHTGWNKNETTLTKANVKNLKAGWGGWAVLNASVGFEPIVVGNIVYFTSEDPDYGARLTAKRVDDLTKLWSFEVFAWPSAPPAYANGRLYFLTSSKLYAFNPATGSVLWKADPGTANGFLAAEGNLVVTASVDRNPSQSGDATVRFFNGTTGALKAATRTGDDDAWGHNGPTIRDGISFVIGNETFAFTSSGAPWTPWKGSASISDNPALPVATSALNLGAGRGGLRASNGTTGYTAWKAAPTVAEGEWWRSADYYQPTDLAKGPYDLAVDGSRVYLAYATPSGARYLTAFNRSTGARVWSKALSVEGPPTVANGVVYVSLGAKGIAALNAATGAELWRNSQYVAMGPVTVANGRVFVYGWMPYDPAVPNSGNSGMLMFQL